MTGGPAKKENPIQNDDTDIEMAPSECGSESTQDEDMSEAGEQRPQTAPARPMARLNTPRRGSFISGGRKTIFDEPKSDTPGPGSYTPKKDRIAGASMPKSAKKVSSSDKSPTGLPGPGEYYINKPRQPKGTSFGRSIKPTSMTYQKPKVIPGPGSYQLKKQDKRASVGATSFGHAVKPSSLPKPTNVPGPGTYGGILTPSKNKGATFSKSLKRVATPLPKSPVGLGPGFYYKERPKTIAATKFASSVKEAAKPLKKTNLPGPGHYEPKTLDRKPSIPIAKAEKRSSIVTHLEANSVTEGDPGLYFDDIGLSPARCGHLKGTIFSRSVRQVSSTVVRDKKALLPGPGSYDPPTPKRKTVTIAKSAKRVAQLPRATTPGPGFYKVERQFPKGTIFPQSKKQIAAPFENSARDDRKRKRVLSAKKSAFKGVARTPIAVARENVKQEMDVELEKIDIKKENHQVPKASASTPPVAADVVRVKEELVVKEEPLQDHDMKAVPLQHQDHVMKTEPVQDDKMRSDPSGGELGMKIESFAQIKQEETVYSEDSIYRLQKNAKDVEFARLFGLENLHPNLTEKTDPALRSPVKKKRKSLGGDVTGLE